MFFRGSEVIDVFLFFFRCLSFLRIEQFLKRLRENVESLKSFGCPCEAFYGFLMRFESFQKEFYNDVSRVMAGSLMKFKGFEGVPEGIFEFHKSISSLSLQLSIYE